MAEEFIKPEVPGLSLFGEDWIRGGYPLLPQVNIDPGPCPVCGTTHHSCTGDLDG